MTRCVTLLLVLGSLFAITANAGDWPDVEPLSAEQLDSASGRQGISMQWQLNETQQNGLVSGNVLSGPVITGDNRISDHAFDNMNGVATVIQNSGNQVVILDSTQINILINH
ncbi:hypothetical protein [Marinobacter shengliensis]|uniref:hypothetical protein n=1 Tax=Marinobacter shengliensis TaxID=1389223 RepID=UPI001E3C9047|nr:hypothetical protein [Marinobacter shengliensis]MCD1628824.1 hypothetical protein [Marinobacter shengliensis]